MTARTDRGFALLIVLWTIVLITLVVTAMTAAGQSQVRQVAALRSAGAARAAVDGAADEAIFRLADGEWAYGPVPQSHTLQVGDTTVQVQVQDEAGMPNVNTIPLVLMDALLQEVGVSAPQASALAQTIQDFTAFPDDGTQAAQYAAAGLAYGPPKQPFRTLDEIGMVAGMTPDILARLAPHISVVNPDNLDPDQADPAVQHAFAQAGPNGGYLPAALQQHQGVAVLRITAHSLPPAAVAWRRATVLLPPTGVAYELMSWN